MIDISYVSLTLVIIGAINWLLVGLFNFDLVAAIFGDMSVVSRIVYVIIGLAGLWCIAIYPRLNNVHDHDHIKHR